MRSPRILAAGLAAAACLAVAAGAAPIALNVKTGLWEITMSGQTSGKPPIPSDVLASMTPEQRAKFDAAMAASRARSAETHVQKTCVTEKSLQNGFDLGNNENDGTCKTTVLASTPTTMEMRQECTGPEKMSMHMRFVAANRERITGTMEMVMTDGTNTMTMNYTMNGRWLGADCGNVKSDD